MKLTDEEINAIADRIVELHPEISISTPRRRTPEDIRIAVLEHLDSCGGSRSFVQLLNFIGGDGLITRQVISSMLSAGELTGSVAAFGHLRITPSGRGALSVLRKEFHHRCQQAARQNQEKEMQSAEQAKNLKKQFRHDFAVVCISTLLTLLIDHFSEIRDLLFHFLQR